MAGYIKLIEQWGKPTANNNRYVVQLDADLSDVEAEFADTAYIIATGLTKIYGTEGWVELYSISTALGAINSALEAIETALSEV